jgi:phospholipid/cholesterol/gamma-HCH transport system ATP-binding protein
LPGYSRGHSAAKLSKMQANARGDSDRAFETAVQSAAFPGQIPPVSADSLVELRDVEFRYDARPVLTGIDMAIGRGKVVAIMGLSGSGKTTILRLIGGQLNPSRGSVSVDGQRIQQLSHRALYALRRRMGMLFQFGALFTDYTVFDNVAFPLREHTRFPEPLIRDLVMMKLNAVGLRGAAGLKPEALSGGMARRVALARAIALDPMLIMYDEPFTGLDPISTGVIANLIRRLNDALGATSIVVTHDVEESFNIADYVYFVSTGVIVTHGTPESLRGSQEPFIHQFIHGDTDGPVPFHYPAPAYARDLGLERRP